MITDNRKVFSKWLVILWIVGCFSIASIFFSNFFFKIGIAGNDGIANKAGLNSSFDDSSTINNELAIGGKGSFLIGNSRLQEKSIKLFLSVPIARKRAYDSSKQKQRIPINIPSSGIDNSGFSIRPVPK